MESSKRIGVIGGGSWATALVKILCENSANVHWYMRNENAVNHFEQYHHNPNYLSSVQFDPSRVKVSNNLDEILYGADILVMVTPSAFLYEMFKDYTPEGLSDKTLFTAIKGIVPEYHSIPARFFHKQFDIPYERIGIISGPCHAEEVALERLSYLTLACPETDVAQDMAKRLKCRYISTTVSEDLFGTELSAVLKNIYAVAAGICHGLGYGDNFQAVLMANAIQEIERFVDSVHPIHRDVKSSAYLGDLLVTGYSQFSRNRTFGNMIGKGYSARYAQLEMNMVAEGYYAVKSIYEMNKKFEVDMPIAEAVYRVIYEKVSPVLEMKLLTEKLS